jgi:glucose/arabinose dehydrogenase
MPTDRPREMATKMAKTPGRPPLPPRAQTCRALLAGALGAALLLGLGGCQAPQQPGGPAPSSALESQASAVTTPSGFSDSVVFTGRDLPTLARFAANGRIFIGEKSGRIWFYDSLTDTTPTLFADLSDKVETVLDRGLSGIALDPDYPNTPNVYVLYTHDDAINDENGQSIANRNASDICPTPPGYNKDGCVSNGRLSRLVDTGSYPISNETVLVDEWPQQFPGHSVQHLTFGPDGYLYASAGDGALHNTTDTGQWGIPVNPLNDPAGWGGALRAQSMRRPAGSNVVLNGAIIRIDKNTGLAAPTNPNINHADVDARRILAFGFRNPFRFTFHPTTGDVWLGDVGAKEYDEIDRVPLAAPVDNFGWPCYEGPARQPGFDGLDLPACENLYTTPDAVAPVFSLKFNTPLFAGDTCTTIGGTAISGLAFYQGGNYPAIYEGALFFSDYSRSCIWYMKKGANGQPDPATVANFAVGASSALDLQIGPGGDLFYLDHVAGALHRIRYQAPTANATADVTGGVAPLLVHFDGSTSTKVSSGDTLTYAWDLDGDGQFDDATGVAPSFTYAVSGSYSARLKVTDQAARSDISAGIVIQVGTPPVPVIDTPTSTTTYVVNQVITFSGHATDEEDGVLPASALSWDLLLEHCPADCHEHSVQSWTGVAEASFPAPDHEYPSHMRLVMRAVDSTGLTTVVVRDLQPQTVDLTFLSTPASNPGLQVGFNFESPATPFTRTVVVGATATVSASSQTVGGVGYGFLSWSDGGAASHTIVAPASPTTYTANFKAAPWTSQDINANAPAGSWSEAAGVHTIQGGGADIWGTADGFRFTHQAISGDATITARVTALSNTNAFAKAGVMFRQNLTAGSINVHALVSPVAGSGYRYSKRSTTGGTSTSEAVTPSPLPDNPGWVRVVRAGNVFTAYYSANGTTFTQLGTPQTIAMGNPIYVGMAVTSHVNGTLATAKFDNVTIKTPTPTPPGAPAGLTASAGNAQVSLAWTATSGATSYTVKRSRSAGGPYTDFVKPGLSTTSFIDTGLANGTTYFYVVSASNAVGEGANSAEKSATPVVPPSAAISNLVVRDTATTNPPAGADGIANSTQWSIQSNFQVNVTAFGDRTVKVTAVPSAGAGLLSKAWIRTAADSKSYTGTPLATFTVGSSFVFLAVDNRHNGTGTRPTWLDTSYVDQGYDITITEGTTARPYSVYRKPVTSGTTVTLPTINSSAAPCYIVIVP